MRLGETSVWERGPEAEAPRSHSPSAKPGHVGISVLFRRHRSVRLEIVVPEPTHGF